MLVDVHPEAIWVPCLSWKLFAVEAALRASESETDEGSVRNAFAVLIADCFCAQLVSPEDCCGVTAGGDAILENRDWSSLS